jgi:hypothetical protein
MKTSDGEDLKLLAKWQNRSLMSCKATLGVKKKRNQRKAQLKFFE